MLEYVLAPTTIFLLVPTPKYKPSCRSSEADVVPTETFLPSSRNTPESETTDLLPSTPRITLAAAAPPVSLAG